jgi:hypothetical protein
VQLVQEPHRPVIIGHMTRWPSFHSSLTSSPMAAIMPAPSCDATSGSFDVGFDAKTPLTTIESVWQSEALAILIRSSPGPGFGVEI